MLRVSLALKSKGTAKVKVEFDRKATEDLFYDPWVPTEVVEPQRYAPRLITSP